MCVIVVFVMFVLMIVRLNCIGLLLDGVDYEWCCVVVLYLV